MKKTLKVIGLMVCTALLIGGISVCSTGKGEGQPEWGMTTIQEHINL